MLYIHCTFSTWVWICADTWVKVMSIKCKECDILVLAPVFCTLYHKIINKGNKIPQPPGNPAQRRKECQGCLLREHKGVSGREMTRVPQSWTESRSAYIHISVFHYTHQSQIMMRYKKTINKTFIQTTCKCWFILQSLYSHPLCVYSQILFILFTLVFDVFCLDLKEM